MIQYSIILVNYKSQQLLLDCLATIVNTQSGKYEIIVVDNASGDNSRSAVLTQYPHIKWMEMNYNSGFARANNAGIRAAAGDTVLLLNTDTLVIGDAVGQCYARLAESAHIAAGVQLLNADGSPQISGNYFMKGGLNHLMAIPVIGSWMRKAGLWLKVKRTNLPEATGEAQVDWINGAFLMVKKVAIEKAGPLDEDFFLFSEEIEWCYRLGKQGSMCIYGDLRVTHLMGGTVTEAFNTRARGYSQFADRKGLQLMVSGLLRVRKQFGVGWLLFHWLMYSAGVLFYFLSCLIPQRRFSQRWSEFSGYARNVFSASLYIPRIIRGKPFFYKLL